MQLESGLEVSPSDRACLRELGKRYADIGHLPVQQETARLWQRLNRLESVRPLIWINEVPWHDMGDSEDLALRTTHPFLQDIEHHLRRELYQWKHMPVDMVIEPVLHCAVVMQNLSGVFEQWKHRPVVKPGLQQWSLRRWKPCGRK